ncbi:MAG: Efflux ABC transporter, permease protein [Parcubacteria group bacterium GW2011_GWA1_50_14]|nr:MAG: Efflux ABC transporter, permease protein [Parcubacteria group bacterium GW2011_GWA1_50_14]
MSTHKSRSLLTILGIVIGVAAIIIVMSLGEGARGLILGQIQSIGSKVIAIIPGREPTGPTDIIASFTDSLKESDLGALQNRNNVPYATQVMPVVFGSESAAYGNETYRPTILGVTDFFSEIYNVYPSKGRVFTPEESRNYADVVVIGSKVESELFGNEDALGKRIRIKGKNLRVIGVIGKTGQLSFLNFDEGAFLPYTTAQQYIFGIKYFNRIVVQAVSEDRVTETVDDIKRTLRAQHNITDPAKDDFSVQTQEEAMQTVSTILNAFTLFLASVAAISLLVGGIGIMNIMLVSVTERTREIGLRKALGATNRNILLQFLLEAVILTAVGGAIGIAIGGGVSFLVALVISKIYGLLWGFALPISAVLMGMGISSAIGLIFGIYPARQASQKSPIEALRYE